MRKNKNGKVFHSHAFGLRSEKHALLLNQSVETVQWSKLDPGTPFYFFTPVNTAEFLKYRNFWKLTEIFGLNSVGIVTSRDDFITDHNRHQLELRVKMLLNDTIPDDTLATSYSLKDKPTWKLRQARAHLSQDKDWASRISKMLYRPFDWRWVFYHKDFIERMREDVMKHMQSDNLGLISVRQVAEGIFNHAFITDTIVESRITLSNKGIGYLFPLFVYPTRSGFFSNIQFDAPVPNFTQHFVKFISKIFHHAGVAVSPPLVFQYIYAILYSCIYRTNYAVELKTDFPRIPFSGDFQIFSRVAALGSQLTKMHLLKHQVITTPKCKFFGKGNSKVGLVKYDAAQNRVLINSGQYFEPVLPDVWDYYIGGYKVMEKWLKDRKGRTLSLEETTTYCKISTALEETVKIQQEIDALYPQVESTLAIP